MSERKDKSIFYKEIPIPSLTPVLGWKQLPIEECGQKLVKLNGLAPELIKVDAQYYKQGIKFSHPEQFARSEVANMLIKAAKNLPPNYKLLILDAWRPLEVQQSLFDGYKEMLKKQNPTLTEEKLLELTQTYVSIPSPDQLKPSPHYTGGAVDLTIIGPNEEEIYMGTDFDHFGPEAATRYYEDPTNIKTNLDILAMNNRRILYHSMQEAGFSVYDEEWWHFDFGNQFHSIRTKEKAIYGPITI